MAQAVRNLLFTTANRVLSHVVDEEFVRGSDTGTVFYLVFLFCFVSVIRLVLHNHVYSTDGNNFKLDYTLNNNLLSLHLFLYPVLCVSDK